jgi:hypothetical protein
MAGSAVTAAGLPGSSSVRAVVRWGDLLDLVAEEAHHQAVSLAHFEGAPRRLVEFCQVFVGVGIG